MLQTLHLVSSAIYEQGTSLSSIANGNVLLEDTGVTSLNLTNTNTIVGAGDANSVGNPGDAHYFDGGISEVIIYSNNTTIVEKAKIESYLALKYGITLDQTTPTAYLASDGVTKIWDETVDGSYNQGIFGIGRDDLSELDQRISKSQDSDAIFIVALDNDFTLANNDAARTTAFSTNLQFLTVANDGGATTTQATELDGANYNVRIAREWQVQNTGTVGAVNVKFDGSWSGFDVLEDTDGDFSTTVDQTVLATLDANGEATGITFTDGAYLTLAGSQTAPGGVASNLTSWYRADIGVVDSGVGTASGWNDQFIFGNNATEPSSAEFPTIVANGLNYNTTLDFDGADDEFGDLANESVLPSGTGARHYFFVAGNDIATLNRWVLGHGDLGVSDASIHIGRAITTGNFFGGDWGGNDQVSDFTYDNEGTFYIQGYSSEGSGLDSFHYQNGAQVAGNDPVYNITPDVGEAAIGSLGPNNDHWDGDIAEIIIYDAVQSGTSLTQIHSYLALKYGITLDQTTATAYLASDGTTKMWDETADAAYNQGIFGIGRDDGSALDQRISKSANTDAIFTLSLDNDFVVPNNDATRTTTFTSDLQFLTVADNGGAITEQSSELDAANYNVRITREWQVQNIGSVGAVNVKFDGNWEGYDLLEDTDGDFSTTGDQTVLATLDANGEATGISFTDGAYLTLAGTQVAPGGVPAALALWLKADAGTVGATNISQWNDQSPNGNNVSEANTANQPTDSVKRAD